MYGHPRGVDQWRRAHQGGWRARLRRAAPAVARVAGAGLASMFLILALAIVEHVSTVAAAPVSSEVAAP
jgi:hypothetical protein